MFDAKTCFTLHYNLRIAQTQRGRETGKECPLASKAVNLRLSSKPLWNSLFDLQRLKDKNPFLTACRNNYREQLFSFFTNRNERMKIRIGANEQ